MIKSFHNRGELVVKYSKSNNNSKEVKGGGRENERLVKKDLPFVRTIGRSSSMNGCGTEKVCSESKRAQACKKREEERSMMGGGPWETVGFQGKGGIDAVRQEEACRGGINGEQRVDWSIAFNAQLGREILLRGRYLA